MNSLDTKVVVTMLVFGVFLSLATVLVGRKLTGMPVGLKGGGLVLAVSLANAIFCIIGVPLWVLILVNLSMAGAGIIFGGLKPLPKGKPL